MGTGLRRCGERGVAPVFAAMEQSRVDIVLLDLTLHQQDGYLLARSMLRGAGYMFAAAVEVVTVNASGSSATYEPC